MRLAALLSLIVVALSAQSAFALPPDAPNCSLMSPPPGAGEDNPQSGLMKIYPRGRDISKSYTGCQRVWLQHNGEWLKFSTRYYQSGVLRAFYGPELNGKLTSVCYFANRKLSAKSRGACPSYDEARQPAPSLAPGCLSNPHPMGDCAKYE